MCDCEHCSRCEHQRQLGMKDIEIQNLRGTIRQLEKLRMEYVPWALKTFNRIMNGGEVPIRTDKFSEAVYEAKLEREQLRIDVSRLMENYQNLRRQFQSVLREKTPDVDWKDWPNEPGDWWYCKEDGTIDQAKIVMHHKKLMIDTWYSGVNGPKHRFYEIGGYRAKWAKVVPPECLVKHWKIKTDTACGTDAQQASPPSPATPTSAATAAPCVGVQATQWASQYGVQAFEYSVGNVRVRYEYK